MVSAGAVLAFLAFGFASRPGRRKSGGTLRKDFLVPVLMTATSTPRRGSLSRQEPDAARGPCSMGPIRGVRGLFDPAERGIGHQDRCRRRPIGY